MSLADDFRDLSFEMAKIVKKEIDQIKKRSEATLSYIEKETIKKIERDTQKLEDQILSEAIIEANKKTSDRITEIYQYVTFVKSNYLHKFLNKLKKRLEDYINADMDKYFSYLNKHINHYSGLIKDNDVLYLNKRDFDYYNKNPDKLKIENKLIVKKMDKESVMGFILESPNQALLIDHRLEQLIELHYQEISINFMKIFPIFEVQTEPIEDYLRAEGVLK